MRSICLKISPKHYCEFLGEFIIIILYYFFINFIIIYEINKILIPYNAIILSETLKCIRKVSNIILFASIKR